jgi:hypothetical protein
MPCHTYRNFTLGFLVAGIAGAIIDLRAISQLSFAAAIFMSGGWADEARKNRMGKMCGEER